MGQSTARYSRQVLFQPIGPSGQEQLQTKRVAVIGVGALGSALAEMLTRAGVGFLRLIDRDFVEWSNLQRQTLYDEKDAKERLPKVIAAKRKLQLINGEVKLEALITDFTPHNAENLTDDVDLILDATDNFETRFLINDVSHKLGIPWIYGACVGSGGMTFNIIPGETPCLHCLVKQIPMQGATCDTAGIIAPAVQQVVSYQAVEALKILLGDPNVRKTLVAFDLWQNEQTEIRVDTLRHGNCEICRDGYYPYLNRQGETVDIQMLCGRNSVQMTPARTLEVDLRELERVLKMEGKVECNPYLIYVKQDNLNLVFFADGRMIVQGTKDRVLARSLYAKYVGC